MRPIGRVLRLQVQTESLKFTTGREKRYDTRALVSVPELVLAGHGVTGRPDSGDDVPDVHHRDHPASTFRGENGISIGFTSHYAAMRDRFGDHLTDGIAGENILIETEDIVHDSDVQTGLLIDAVDGRQALLGDISVATPCVPFSRFAFQLADEAKPDRALIGALQFLNDGMRGFYLTLRGELVVIAIGAAVYVV
jgi:hypothetical protein